MPNLVWETGTGTEMVTAGGNATTRGGLCWLGLGIPEKMRFKGADKTASGMKKVKVKQFFAAFSTEEQFKIVKKRWLFMQWNLVLQGTGDMTYSLSATVKGRKPYWIVRLSFSITHYRGSYVHMSRFATSKIQWNCGHLRYSLLNTSMSLLHGLHKGKSIAKSMKLTRWYSHIA